MFYYDKNLKMYYNEHFKRKLDEVIIEEIKNMKKYLVRFTTKGGDYDKEWCYANSEEEAKNNILNEHWNIAHIDSAQEL